MVDQKENVQQEQPVEQQPEPTPVETTTEAAPATATDAEPKADEP